MTYFQAMMTELSEVWDTRIHVMRPHNDCEHWVIIETDTWPRLVIFSDKDAAWSVSKQGFDEVLDKLRASNP